MGKHGCPMYEESVCNVKSDVYADLAMLKTSYFTSNGNYATVSASFLEFIERSLIFFQELYLQLVFSLLIMKGEGV